MHEVDVRPAPLERLTGLLSESRAERLVATAAQARQLLADRVVWNINATAQGGGVAEMLQVLLAYGRGAGVDTRWLALDGDAEFFNTTKRIHNTLHGVPVGDFDAADREHYERVLAANLADVGDRIRPGDIVLLHDPQTAGLAEGVRGLGARVVWRSHIGRDESNDATDRGWSFLRPYIEHADGFVFSRRRYIPDWLPASRTWVIAPSIDTFAAKNRELDDAEIDLIVCRAGLIEGGGDETVSFTRRDGTLGTVRPHRAVVSGSPPPRDARLVVQVSRWDRLKDMTGVLAAFADHVAPAVPDAHLLLAGPDVSGVTDDPEGAEVFAACQDARQRLPADVRERCHLASIPMDDIDENAIIVNALQRWATVIVQKSLVEGFGLTVTEAMWKRRPVLASAVGGIQDQITDGADGLLVPDPSDLPGFAQRLRRLLDDQSLALRLAQAGHRRVTEEFLGDRHLIQYVDLFDALINDSPAHEVD